MGRATCFTPDVLLWLRHAQAVRSKMVADAVGCEPVSGANSLISGNLLGNSVPLPAKTAVAARLSSKIQSIRARSLMSASREFWLGEQGFFCAFSGLNTRK